MLLCLQLLGFHSRNFIFLNFVGRITLELVVGKFHFYWVWPTTKTPEPLICLSLGHQLFKGYFLNCRKNSLIGLFFCWFLFVLLFLFLFFLFNIICHILSLVLVLFVPTLFFIVLIFNSFCFWLTLVDILKLVSRLFFKNLQFFFLLSLFQLHSK